jgi:hypothetical protein
MRYFEGSSNIGLISYICGCQQSQSEPYEYVTLQISNDNHFPTFPVVSTSNSYGDP